MTHHIDNALLMHGEEPAIPYPAPKSIVNDALKPDCEALQRQNEALEEANHRVCDERDMYKSLCHQLEARLAGKVYD